MICLRSIFNAASEKRLILMSLSFPKVYFSDMTPFSVATAIQTVPTGFSSDPPSGPAIPEVATDY
jgi:hypothetical protein